MAECCATCRFMRFGERANNGRPTGQPVRVCARFPPQTAMVDTKRESDALGGLTIHREPTTNWPEVGELAWCGEWQERPPA